MPKMIDKNEKQGNRPDITLPNDERQEELRLARTMNDEAVPYQGIELRTLGEVLWIMDTEGWSGVMIPPEGKQQANFSGARFVFVNLSGADLWGAKLSDAHFLSTNLRNAHLIGADLRNAHLTNSNLSGAYLRRSDLRNADLRWANLRNADISGADLSNTQFDGANLSGAKLLKANISSADLRRVTMDSSTILKDIILDNRKVRLADITWGNANLVVVDWSSLLILGDEIEARKSRSIDGKEKPNTVHLSEWKQAVRAYRLLANILRSQGMSDEADRFAYRTQICQREVYRLQKQWGRYSWSWFLFLLSGYGYRPWNSVFAYLLIQATFTSLYLLNSHFVSPHLSLVEAFVLSISSFHGRGFLPQTVTLGDTYALLAALEAIIGLFIEISFIATFTQRFFGR